VLITHAGLSGPGILKLSAWGARDFAEKNYAFPIAINWVPPHTRDTLVKALSVVREQNARKQITTFSPVAMPQRLWERFVIAAGIPTTTPGPTSAIRPCKPWRASSPAPSSRSTARACSRTSS
jgi:predicted flavoprotein YhiN